MWRLATLYVLVAIAAVAICVERVFDGVQRKLCTHVARHMIVELEADGV